MERLDSLYYSVSTSHSRSSSNKRKIWKYYDTNGKLMNLEYDYSVYNVSMYVKNTMKKEDVQQTHEKFTISSMDTRNQSELIKDINVWLNTNFDLLKTSYDNCMKSFEIIDFLKNELGDYNYCTTYEVGWSVKDFYKLYIDLYSKKITLNYKGKETILSEEKLKIFIKKNKKLINQAKENEHKKYLERLEKSREEERIKKLSEETDKLSIDKSMYDATKKVGYNSKSSSFSVPRTLKQRYEAQACKPFPEKYPWERKRKN
jgi:hypothetical protein